MSAGITAGARGAAAGLGQASAGNARTLPRPRKPGLKSKSRGLETPARAAVERREASAPEADRPCARRARARTDGDICSCGAAHSICAFRRSASLYIFGGETSVAFVLAAKLGREGRRENALALPSPGGGGSRPEGTRGGVCGGAGISSALRALSPHPATLRVHSRCFASAFLVRKTAAAGRLLLPPSRGR